MASVMDVVASTVRAGITAPPGKMLVVSDLSSIESRVLGWTAGCTRINNIFAEGKDTYKDFATEMFHCSYDEVTKAQRTLAKPAVLGCGYQLGAAGLVRYADSMGIEMTGKEAKHAVKTFRTVYWEVAEMWQWLVDACKHVIEGGGTFTGYAVTISRDDQFMFITLPSGRRLHYYQPQVQPKTITILDPETGEERKWETEAVTYMGKHEETFKWWRISTHGGKITENIVQAIARDILAEGLRLAEADPLLELVGHVHDEAISLADEANAEEALRRQNEYLSRPVPWAPGLLLGAEGYIAKRYRKE